MKVLYLLLVLTMPLMNGLFNNNTDSINSSTCQCTCHNPYLGETGDNWSARSYVDYHTLLNCISAFRYMYRVFIQSTLQNPFQNVFFLLVLRYFVATGYPYNNGVSGSMHQIVFAVLAAPSHEPAKL